MKQNFKLITGIVFFSLMAGSASNTFASNEQNNRGVISQFHQNGKAWSNVNAADLNDYLGDDFSVLTSDNQSISLKLVNVIAGKTDPNRPSFLLRNQSVIAVFSATKADRDWLARSGSQTVDSWHHALGNGKVFLTPIKKSDGEYSIEIVLD